MAIVGAILTAVVAIFKYFRFQSKRDIRAAVGKSFASTVEALGSANETSRMAGAVLLRRFFDRHTEQGAAGTPYIREAIALIAGMLRDEKVERAPRLQKVLADGLGYAIDLQNVDLQQCNLRNAYFGTKPRDVGKKPRHFVTKVRHSLRKVRYFGRKAPDKVVVVIEGARFAGAKGIPLEVADLLDEHGVGRQGAVVPKPAGSG